MSSALPLAIRLAYYILAIQYSYLLLLSAFRQPSILIPCIALFRETNTMHTTEAYAIVSYMIPLPHLQSLILSVARSNRKTYSNAVKASC